MDDFLTALDAYRTALDNEDTYVQSQIDAAVDLIALYKALGGGWEIVEPPPAAAPASR